MIYADVNTKGGVGKTTSAVHLFTMLARTEKTLLIDGDPQASAASWAAWRREAERNPSPTTTRLAGKAFLSAGKTLSEGFAHTAWTPAAAIRWSYVVPCSWRAIGEGAIVQELGKDPSSSQEMEAFLAEVSA